jgi:hypothetical protein
MQDTWLQRITKAMKLDADFYARVASDTSLSQEALWLIIIPSWLVTSLLLCVGLNLGDLRGIIISLVGSIAIPASFSARAGLIYYMGRRFFGSTATYAKVQRTLGYAFTTRYVRIVTFIVPGLGDIVAMGWALVSDYVATRSALGVGKGPALMIAILSSVVFYLGMLVLVILVIDVAAFYEWLFGRLGF